MSFFSRENLSSKVYESVTGFGETAPSRMQELPSISRNTWEQFLGQYYHQVKHEEHKFEGNGEERFFGIELRVDEPKEQFGTSSRDNEVVRDIVAQ
jgi:hypothetical protein